MQHTDAKARAGCLEVCVWSKGDDLAEGHLRDLGEEGGGGWGWKRCCGLRKCSSPLTLARQACTSCSE